MKNRLEDIGYIRAKLEFILNHAFWDGKIPDVMTDDVDCLHAALMDCLDVAKGEDYLNQPEEGR